jgi:hypothetical protein
MGLSMRRLLLSAVLLTLCGIAAGCSRPPEAEPKPSHPQGAPPRRPPPPKGAG